MSPLSSLPPPVDPKDTLTIVESAKGTWQWLAGGVASGAYAVWKYLNSRIGKLEDCIVTAKQFKEHTDTEEAKFTKLFQFHEDTLGEIKILASGLARIEGQIERSNGHSKRAYPRRSKGVDR